ncbi:unnamed protein product [Mortierella alpina]
MRSTKQRTEHKPTDFGSPNYTPFENLAETTSYFDMDSHASTATLITTENDVKEMHPIESSPTHSHWRVPSFYAQLLVLKEDDIVHLTAEKLVEEYETQARILEKIQAPTQPQPQPQSLGKKLRRQRRIMQEAWSMDDLKCELPSVETKEVPSQQRDQLMRPNSPVRHNVQSPMQQSESAITVHSGQQRGMGYFSKFWARIRPSNRSSPLLQCSAAELVQHQSGRPQKPLRTRCNRRRKGQGFIAAPSHGTPTTHNAGDTSAESIIDLSASDPGMTLNYHHQSACSLDRSSSETAVDPQSYGHPGIHHRRKNPTVAHRSTSNVTNSSIQSAQSRPSFSSKRSSRQRTDSAYSQTASSSSQTKVTSQTREAAQCKPPPRKLSIVVVGGGAVGKSAMTLRFLRDQFHDEYDPTIEDSYCKHITVDGQNYILDLTDTSGQFEYRSQWNDAFMRSADGFICVYSVTSLGSFREVVSYRDQIWRAKDSEHVPIMMVGNKCDLEAYSERRVGTNAVARFAERSNALFLEASAKTGQNVNSVFIELVRQIEWQRRRVQDGMDDVSRGSFVRHSQEKETRASIKGFATNIPPPISAPSCSRGQDAQQDVKTGLCGCTIM